MSRKKHKQRTETTNAGAIPITDKTSVTTFDLTPETDKDRGKRSHKALKATAVLAAGITCIGAVRKFSKKSKKEPEPEAEAPAPAETERGPVEGALYLPAEAATVPAEPAASEEIPHKRGLFRPKPKAKYYNITSDNDIRFKGPLSYRHLKMIAWLLIVLSVAGMMLLTYSEITDTVEQYDSVVSVLSFGRDFAVPLLLFAGFATVLNGRDNYKKLIIMNAAIACALAGLFIVVYERYVMRGAEALFGQREYADAWIDHRLNSPGSSGYMTFNIFIDLTLCTLVLFFINYKPKKFFQGWKICIFRGLVLLPISYEIVSICIKVLASNHVLTVSPYIFPFLTTKPPAGFLLFVILARYFKETEYKFKKLGKTHEDYEAYLQTNHNSFRFAKFAAVAVIAVVLIDLGLLILIAALHLVSTGQTGEISELKVLEALDLAYSWGFGNTLEMITIIPVLLLFSYTKTHKNKIIDIAVPIGGILLILIVCFDSIFTIICEVIKANYASYAV